MDSRGFLQKIKALHKINSPEIIFEREDEVYIRVSREEFGKMCIVLHEQLHSPVMSYFASDERRDKNVFTVRCAFLSPEYRKWVFVVMEIPGHDPVFPSIAREIYSASLFEREINEMYGLEPSGNPDARRLRLHDEVWPEGYYPLRKDFIGPPTGEITGKQFQFVKVEGEGIFEVPVGPVHAGIIGPGHFRFSAAGEPIINLEIRLGFTHRGVEKIFEGKSIREALKLSECLAGDAAFAYSTAFCRAIEKIADIPESDDAKIMRAIFIEMERMYNHAADIGGMAIDVGFSFPANLAAIIKENMLVLNGKLAGHRYLKHINTLGGVTKILSVEDKALLLSALKDIKKDFTELEQILQSSVSFMDRVDTTGVLRKMTAEDFGVLGVAGRASGISLDLRSVFPETYNSVNFQPAKDDKGDVLARLKIRLFEFKESMRMIEEFAGKLKTTRINCTSDFALKAGFGLGYAESWRGPVLFWVKLDDKGIIERCKVVDPSFHNWLGLSFAVLGNIIPDFPLCNKSFNLSYAGNDL